MCSLDVQFVAAAFDGLDKLNITFTASWCAFTFALPSLAFIWRKEAQQEVITCY